MKIIDCCDFENDVLLSTDLCIVGSGPVGLSIAHEFAGAHLEVLVLESGGLEKEADTQALYEIENTGALLPENQEQSYRLRIYGGTSRIWTGRCAPFDQDDFEARSWISHSGWPISRAELDPYFVRAGAYLGLGPHCYDDSLWPQFKVPKPTPPLDARVVEPCFWQFSVGRDTRRSVDFSSDLKFPSSANLNVLLHANVTHINTNEDVSVFDSVEIRMLNGKRGKVRARALVLGSGGIENARLLLASNRQVAAGLGNEHDLVGRFLMDHPLGVIGRFDSGNTESVRDRFGHYWLDNREGRHVYLHGLALSKEVQRNEHLLKCHAFLEDFDVAADDAWEAMRRFRSALKSGRLRDAVIREGRVLLANPGTIARGVYRRVMKHRPHLKKAARVELHCMLEQMPDPESRITLSTRKKDALGMPISKVHWKIGEVELRTARRMAHLVCQEFRRLKLPVPSLASWTQSEESGMPRFDNKAHPTGTTRISTNPREGVVDANLQVHGVRGLFVAGSSVFPTSGAVNPTLMAVAVAIRLADWLKASYFKSS
jgi:choline dehydrogenase-like flavoprotein